MKTKLLMLLMIAFMSVITACEKEETPFNSCEKITLGLAGNSANDMRLGINQLISELPSSEYSGPNLDKLAETMTNSCGVSASVTCLNCNHGFPLVSEITVDYTLSGQPAQKIITITHNAANAMVFESMRD